MKFAALIVVLAVASAEDIAPLDGVRSMFYSLEAKLWRNVTDPLWTETTIDANVVLAKAFAEFDDRIQPIPMMHRPPLSSSLWDRLFEHLQLIDGFYKHFSEFVRRETTPGAVSTPVHEWIDLTEKVLHDSNSSVVQSTEGLRNMMNNRGEILLYQNALLEERTAVCVLQMSSYQLLYNIYNTIALTEFKAYVMMQFSWMLLKIYGKGNYTQEANLTRQIYGQRASQSAQVARSALRAARRDVFKCDPPEHIEGTTYDQVKRFLQGYIENEVNLNIDGSCRENCAHYTLANFQRCFEGQYCEKQRVCKGRIMNCRYMDSDMLVCPASSQSSNRRYEWIKYENGQTLGKVGDCTQGTTKVDSWWRGFLHCSYCMCLCDDVTDSDRHFSLWDSTSDVNNNKVVTGIRLVKYKRVFHLQIYEGTLKERGFIESSGWVPIRKSNPFDGEYREGQDFHTLTYERRAIDLDEVDSPEGSILTGVRFRVTGAHLQFEIRSTPFNYTTGRLSPGESQWISNYNTEGYLRPRSKLEFVNQDIPTASRAVDNRDETTVDSEHNQYIEFTHSDFDADAAQSTVPFIDVQPVLPGDGSTLISGAGVIHRGTPSSGGFIAIKLITYPYGKHIKEETTSSRNLRRGNGSKTGRF